MEAIKEHTGKKNMKILRIYLADLVYDTVKTNYVVPLNIAYIAALTKQTFWRKC